MIVWTINTTKSVWDLCFPGPEFPKHLSNGHAFNATAQQLAAANSRQLSEWVSKEKDITTAHYDQRVKL